MTVRTTLGLSHRLVTLLAVSAHAQGGARPALAEFVKRFVSVDAPVVALTHVRLVDGSGQPAKDDQTIVIDGARIRAVGPCGRACRCRRARR